MEKEFLPYEQALALRLKALGFDEPCLGYYAVDILCTGQPQEIHLDEDGNYKKSKTESFPITVAPTFSQAFRWFRDKYDLYPSINIYNDKWLCVIKSTISNETEISGYIVATINNGHPTFETYEEAELKCLEKLIEIVESKTEK
jgi:hypothetical protein